MRLKCLQNNSHNWPILIVFFRGGGGDGVKKSEWASPISQVGEEEYLANYMKQECLSQNYNLQL